MRLGIAAVILLICLVGGRIVPSFTHNWLVRENPGRLPISVRALRCASSIAMQRRGPRVLGRLAAASIVTGALLLLAGLLHAVRLARWAGDRTWRDRLVLVLHVAYAFVPLGFLLTGPSSLWPR